jgi:hypothetical protein
VDAAARLTLTTDQRLDWTAEGPATGPDRPADPFAEPTLF